MIDGEHLAFGVLPFRPAPAKARPPRHHFAPPRIDAKVRPPSRCFAPLLTGGKLLTCGVLPSRLAAAKARPTFYRLAPPTIDIKFCNFRRDVL